MINDIDATTARFDSLQREEQGDVRREVAAIRGALIDADPETAQAAPSTFLYSVPFFMITEMRAP